MKSSQLHGAKGSPSRMARKRYYLSRFYPVFRVLCKNFYAEALKKYTDAINKIYADFIRITSPFGVTGCYIYVHKNEVKFSSGTL